VNVADTKISLLIILFIRTVNVAFAEIVLENVAIRERDVVAASVTEKDRFMVVRLTRDTVDARSADRVTNFDFN
jgi:acyl-CoA synthetase (NDP forming)